MESSKMVVNKLLIVDPVNKVSNEYEFKEKVNVLVGQDNKVGKSSLIKSIYFSLGMDNTSNMPAAWNYKDMIYLVSFNINSYDYQILRKDDNLFLKSSENFEIVSKSELGQWYMEKLSLNFTLITKSGAKIIYPGYLFIPFYLDQDNSWDQEPYKFPPITSTYPVSERTKLWNNYLGISNEYLEAIEEKIKKKNQEITRLSNQIELMKNLINRFKVENDGLKASPNTVKSIKLYIERINDLNKKLLEINNEILKKEDKLNEWNRILLNLEKAVGSLDKEKEILRNNCSLCGTKISIEKLAQEGEIELNKIAISFEIQKVRRKIEKELANIDDFAEEYSNIERTLKEYKNTLTDYPELSSIEDAIEDRSNTLLIDKLMENRSNDLRNVALLKDEISEHKQEQSALKKSLSERKKEIRNSYNEIFREYKLRLVMKDDSHNFNLGFLDFSQITGSGTDIDLKRLTRYLTYFELFNKYSLVMLPQAIDSVIFTEASKGNYEQIFNTIEEKYLKSNNQTFFTILEENLKYMSHVSLGSDFVIYLERDKRLLNDKKYDEHYTIIESILDSF